MVAHRGKTGNSAYSSCRIVHKDITGNGNKRASSGKVAVNEGKEQTRCFFDIDILTVVRTVFESETLSYVRYGTQRTFS